MATCRESMEHCRTGQRQVAAVERRGTATTPAAAAAATETAPGTATASTGGHAACRTNRLQERADETTGTMPSGQGTSQERTYHEQRHMDLQQQQQQQQQQNSACTEAQQKWTAGCGTNAGSSASGHSGHHGSAWPQCARPQSCMASSSGQSREELRAAIARTDPAETASEPITKGPNLYRELSIAIKGQQGNQGDTNCSRDIHTGDTNLAIDREIATTGQVSVGNPVTPSGSHPPGGPQGAQWIATWRVSGWRRVAGESGRWEPPCWREIWAQEWRPGPAFVRPTPIRPRRPPPWGGHPPPPDRGLEGAEGSAERRSGSTEGWDHRPLAPMSGLVPVPPIPHSEENDFQSGT